ncbi:MAG: sigma-54 interaction domain-containing protein [Vicinamibacterales bacterium]
MSRHHPPRGAALFVPTPGQHEVMPLVGRDPQLLRVLDIVNRAADTEASVLILGESGTGKEIIARLLHQRSKRREGPFVPVNCGSVPESLQESELFGHMKGAYTGADERALGKIEAAADGTIFLDEIGEMTPALQPKLLRFLQFGEYSPVGCPHPLRCRVRIVAATHRNLRDMVANGLFRADLYYRLNVLRLELPPLRERHDDIGMLIEHFVGVAAGMYQKGITGLTPSAGAALQAYSYPGNVRELENIIHAAVLLARGPVIDLADLPAEVTVPHATVHSRAVSNFHSAKASVIAEFEHKYLTRLLEESHGVVSTAARLCGLSERNLHIKLKQYRLTRYGNQPERPENG